MLIKLNKVILPTLLAFVVMIIIFPQVVSGGVCRGLLISANIIIPSLFPFTVIVLMIIKCTVTIENKTLNKITNKLLGQNCEMFFVFLLSVIGGYPIGAKLINETYLKKKIDKQNANIMLIYCVNAGPAFVISVVGYKIYNSQKIGILLYLAHILSSIILAIICGFFSKKHKYNTQIISRAKTPITKIFIESVSDATASVLNICSFIIIFSAFNDCVEYIAGNFPIIKHITLFTEVTSSITKCNNIFLISFLLGFSGISVWCQIFSLCNFKINIFKFITGRILHGTFSMFITKFLFKIFKVKISVFSNINYANKSFYSEYSLFISIFIMLIVLITYIYSKNNSRKFIKDVI